MYIRRKISTVLKFLVRSEKLRIKIRAILSPVTKFTLVSYANYAPRAGLRTAKNKMSKGKQLNVCFFVFDSAIWKLDNLFKLMLKDGRFNPVIVTCPYLAYGKENMWQTMTNVDHFFRAKNYPVINTWDNGRWINVLDELQPDILFLTNPHALTRPEYEASYFLDKLTIYVPYHHQFCTDHALQINQLFHNIVWKCFYVHPIIKSLTQEHMMNKGRNVEVTGYPGTELFYDPDYQPKDVWKIKDRKVKRIIWAVHHTLTADDGMALSSFLAHAELFKKLLAEFQDSIQIAFKPHPLLKLKLYEHADWGKEKTDQYFNFWASQTNSQLEESAYEDLCLTSDAMIHDCGSFLIEYLYLNKPVLFTSRDNVRARLNPFAQMAYDVSYKPDSYDDNEIRTFIQDTVINCQDSKKEERKGFVNQHLLPADAITPSQKIFDFITAELGYKNVVESKTLVEPA